MRFLIWPFWRSFGNKAAVENARHERFEKEFQLARAEIIAAKIRGGSGGYHRFLTVAQRSLESGEVKPDHVIRVMKLAEEGKHHHHDLQMTLYGLKRPENQLA